MAATLRSQVLPLNVEFCVTALPARKRLLVEHAKPRLLRWVGFVANGASLLRSRSRAEPEGCRGVCLRWRPRVL